MLHWAVGRGDEALARTLILERGADVRATKADGQTPLHLAAARASEGIVRLLLQVRVSGATSMSTFQRSVTV